MEHEPLLCCLDRAICAVARYIAEQRGDAAAHIDACIAALDEALALTLSETEAPPTIDMDAWTRRELYSVVLQFLAAASIDATHAKYDNMQYWLNSARIGALLLKMKGNQ